MLNKGKISFVIVFLLVAWFIYADPAGDIAKAGDAAWNNLIDQYKKESRWMDPVSANVVVNNFDRYDGKVMLFPAIDFGDFISDRNGDRYYWYGEKNSLNVFVIKYHPGIQDQLYMLNNGLGNMGGKYEVLGKIVDAWEWWGNVVLMEVTAMRVKNRACVVLQNNNPVLAGKDIFDRYMAELAANWTKGIPQNATSVPQGLEPEMVAKWFLYYGSNKKNQTIWNQLCSVQENAISGTGTLQAKGQSWWRMISMTDREYYFVRAEPSRDTATSKVFMYQIRQEGKDMGVAKPMAVIKENAGQWRVSSF
jgi:NADPH-dependent 7-cyano-7-deazaguanine reductase QueF-like protein